jgi:hypothetical protein
MNLRSKTNHRHVTMGWTPEEDAIVLSVSLDEATKRLKRTRGAIIAHKYLLRHPEPQTADENNTWTVRECAILRERYPSAKDTRDLLPYLPRFTRNQLRSKAHHMGLKRKFFGDCDVRTDGHMELIDQIRIRAKQDGIALYKIDAVLKTGYYFTRNWKRHKKVNLRAVAKAVEFFGAKLVIDWCDR